MHVVHLTASTFFGGPERQMLGLAEHLPKHYRSTYLSFPESGRCQEFLNQVRVQGIPSAALTTDTPRVRETLNELTAILKSQSASVLVTHTFKPNVLGRIAARRLGIPVITVSRGWTWENLKVRVYETIDRVNLRYVDHVVAVSQGQAERVRKAGVPSTRMSVIRNAARLAAFASPKPEFREQLQALFPDRLPPKRMIIAAGRLSPEKGFSVLVDAAAEVLRQDLDCGFVLFGEGNERAAVEGRVREHGIQNRFRMPGFTNHLDAFLPWAQVVVLPSFTEGLPNVALEASAAGVPVVATAVGGTPEVVENQETGFLVPSGDAAALAGPIVQLLKNEALRTTMGRAAKCRMEEHFTFSAQARRYVQLFEKMIALRAGKSL